MFYLTMHSTHFIYGYMASNIRKKTTQNKRGNLLLPLHGLLFPISSKGLLFAPSHRQNSIYHGNCYTCRAMAGMRFSSMGPPWGIDPTTRRTMNGRATSATFRSYPDVLRGIGSIFLPPNLYSITHDMYQKAPCLQIPNPLS